MSGFARQAANGNCVQENLILRSCLASYTVVAKGRSRANHGESRPREQPAPVPEFVHFCASSHLDLDVSHQLRRNWHPILSRIAKSLHQALRQLTLREIHAPKLIRHTPYSTSAQEPSAAMVSHRKGTRKYYAVRIGTKPGVYHTYDDCLAQVRGFKGAICKLILQPGRHDRFFANRDQP